MVVAVDSAEEVARKALELLPQILKERPDLAFKLYEELRKHFVPRDAFEKFLERFDAALREMKEIREEYNRRFEELRREMNQRFEEVTRRVNELAVEVRNIRIELGAVGRRLGRGLQRLILETYEDALRRFGVEIKEIRGLKVTDPDGKVVPKGGFLEVDVFITDERKVFIEVKAYVERDDAEWFWAKTRRIEELLGIKADRVIVAAEATDLAREFCKQNKIALIAHEIVKEEEE